VCRISVPLARGNLFARVCSSALYTIYSHNTSFDEKKRQLVRRESSHYQTE
jgi:hypothetical protein